MYNATVICPKSPHRVICVDDVVLTGLPSPTNHTSSTFSAMVGLCSATTGLPVLLKTKTLQLNIPIRF